MLESYAIDEHHYNPAFEDLEESLFPYKRKKIMVVDDDQDFRLSVCELLVDEGFSVTTAKDGESGINSLIHQKERPDLILLDLMMPIKSGMEFRREQLQLDEVRNIPVMFMTGYGYVDGELCMMKPFDEKEFIRVVKSHLSI